MDRCSLCKRKAKCNLQYTVMSIWCKEYKKDNQKSFSGNIGTNEKPITPPPPVPNSRQRIFNSTVFLETKQLYLLKRDGRGWAKGDIDYINEVIKSAMEYDGIKELNITIERLER